MTSTLDIYRKQLDEINHMQSPNELFNKIDALIKSYQSLKRQYTAEFRAHHQQYDSKIRTYISKSANNSNKSIPISTKNIQTFINKMKKLQLSFQDWIQNVSNTNIYYNKTKQNDTKSLSITTTKNIKPSH
eukprot:507792_1